FDYVTSKGAPSATVITDASLQPIGGTFNFSTTPQGCYLDLRTQGEKVVTSAVSASGFTDFSTNMPTVDSAGVCRGNLGDAQSYRVEMFCGAFEAVPIAGGGLPPSPLMGTVTIDIGGGETRQFEFLIGTPAAQGKNASGVSSGLEIYRPGGK